MSQPATAAHAAQLERRIVLVRGQRVMLDRDIAELYEVPTKVLNQAVKRNLGRFPPDFMFQLTDGEAESLRAVLGHSDAPAEASVAHLPDETRRSQSVTSSAKFRRTSYLPYAFTEHGVAMLSSVLRSPRAIEASIAIIRVFVRLRSLAASTADLSARLDELERRHDRKFRVVFEAIRGLMDPAPTPPREPRREIGFHTRVDGRLPRMKGRPCKKVSP